MVKYSAEEKMKVVLAVEEKGYSFAQAAKTIGACKADAQKWVRLYREHGAEGLLLKKGKYDGLFKVEVVEYMHEHKLSIRETAAKFGIPAPMTVALWERIYYEEGPQALYRDNRGRKKCMSTSKPQKTKLSKQTEEDLIAENQQLRMENAYLKKLNALVRERIQRENGKKS